MYFLDIYVNLDETCVNGARFTHPRFHVKSTKRYLYNYFQGLLNVVGIKIADGAAIVHSHYG